MAETVKLYARPVESQPLSVAWVPEGNFFCLLNRTFSSHAVSLSKQEFLESITSGSVELAGPLELCWSILHACNLHCPYCLDGGKGLPLPILSLQERYLHQLLCSQSLLTMDICGGEPLLHRHLYEILSAIKNAEIGVTMTTHGAFLANHASRLAEYLDGIRISIDGSTAEKHERLRGQAGLFEKMVRGIKAARQQGLRVSVNTVAMKPNADDWENIIRLAQDLGATEIWLLQFLPLGPGAKLKEEYEIDTQWFLEQGTALQSRYTTSTFTVHLRDSQQEAAGYVVVYANGAVFANADMSADQGQRQVTLGSLGEDALDVLWRRQFGSRMHSFASL